MAGRLIVIEGTDGSGKATQTALLRDRFEGAGIPVRAVSFPDYDSDSSALVRMYLGGAFGSRPDDVNAYAASCFYACDRYASWRTKWQADYEAGTVILADRYTTSNAVHQCVKLPKEQWDSYLQWLFDFEYRLLGIPEPETVIYLQGDPAVSRALLRKRYAGDESKKDIHEKDADYQRRAKEAADYCAARLGWQTVPCIRDGAMRTPEDIHAQIAAVLRLK